MLISQISNFYNNKLISNHSRNKPQTGKYSRNVSTVSFGVRKDDKHNYIYNAPSVKTAKSSTKSDRYVSGFHSDSKLIDLPLYIASEVKENEVQMVNVSRKNVLNDWFLELERISSGKTKSQLTEEFIENPHLRLFVLSSLTTSLQSSNRIIPPPFDVKALETTISSCFGKDYNKKVSSSSFIAEYNSALVEQTIDELINRPIFDSTLLYTKEGKLLDKKDLKSAKNISSLWVKIPSSKKSSSSYADVSTVEKLSNPNWCTRSKHNKAISVLYDGAFYIFLERNMNGKWDSKAAITTFEGKISQIQGKKNDNFIPMQMRGVVAKFLSEIGAISTTQQNHVRKNNRCHVGYETELPYAYTQLLIGQKLAEVTKKPDGVRTISLNTALKFGDSLSALKLLYPNSEPKLLENGKISIKSYKPSVHIDNKTQVVPISLLNIDENKLLADVEEVTGNINLSDSSIDSFPQSLKTVGGKLVLSLEQYNKFKNLIEEQYTYSSLDFISKKMKETVVITGLKIKE